MYQYTVVAHQIPFQGLRGEARTTIIGGQVPDHVSKFIHNYNFSDDGGNALGLINFMGENGFRYLSFERGQWQDAAHIAYVFESPKMQADETIYFAIMNLQAALIRMIGETRQVHRVQDIRTQLRRITAFVNSYTSRIDGAPEPYLEIILSITSLSRLWFQSVLLDIHTQTGHSFDVRFVGDGNNG